MEDGFKALLFAFIFVSLFGMLFLSATINVADKYDKDTSEVVGGALSMDRFNSSISDLETTAMGWKETFVAGSIWDIAGVVVTGIFGIAKLMMNLILTPFGIIIGIMIDVFGVPTWVTSTLIGVIIISIIFGVWRLIKIGD